MSATEVSRYWPELVPLIQSRRLRPQHVVTHSYAMADAGQAYSDYAARSHGILKPVLVP